MTLDWTRLFPDSDHRWIMGLGQRDSLRELFADSDATGLARAERARWLAEDPEKYAALLPEAEPALRETVALARSQGAKIEEGQTAFETLLGLGRGWESDFVWMHPSAAGRHQVIGGVICFPSSWALEEKLGRPMREVHDPVPGLNDALDRQIETFLRKQEPEVAWTRDNWSLSRDSELNHHPSRTFRLLDASITADEVWLRLEHQLLLKLPQSGSILFGIRMAIVPLRVVVADRQAAARFTRILSTLSPAAAAYKNLASALPTLLALLRG